LGSRGLRGKAQMKLEMDVYDLELFFLGFASFYLFPFFAIHGVGSRGMVRYALGDFIFFFHFFFFILCMY
jgi:hypothetical protein